MLEKIWESVCRWTDGLVSGNVGHHSLNEHSDMKTNRFWRAGLAAGLSFTTFTLVAAEADLSTLPPAATRPVDFLKDVQPIFENSCSGCHGSKKQESALRLDQKADAFKGGETFPGKAIMPGHRSEEHHV